MSEAMLLRSVVTILWSLSPVTVELFLNRLGFAVKIGSNMLLRRVGILTIWSNEKIIIDVNQQLPHWGFLFTDLVS